MLPRKAVSFPVCFLLGVLQIPVIAFILCVALSLIQHYGASTATLCRVENFLPSFSSAVGNFQPQRSIWRFAIAVNMFPRMVVALFYLRMNLKLAEFRRLVDDSSSSASHSDRRNFFTCSDLNYSNGFHCMPFMAFCFNLLELIGLFVLSFVTSEQNFPVHCFAFCGFVVCSCLYMLLTLCMHSKGQKFLSREDLTSYTLKKRLCIFYFCALISAAYFYVRHNSYCERYIYSYFALSEYVAIFVNIAYHGTAAIDFRRKKILLLHCDEYNALPSAKAPSSLTNGSSHLNASDENGQQKYEWL